MVRHAKKTLATRRRRSRSLRRSLKKRSPKKRRRSPYFGMKSSRRIDADDDELSRMMSGARVENEEDEISRMINKMNIRRTPSPRRASPRRASPRRASPRRASPMFTGLFTHIPSPRSSTRKRGRHSPEIKIRKAKPLKYEKPLKRYRKGRIDIGDIPSLNRIQLVLLYKYFNENYTDYRIRQIMTENLRDEIEDKFEDLQEGFDIDYVDNEEVYREFMRREQSALSDEFRRYFP